MGISEAQLGSTNEYSLTDALGNYSVTRTFPRPTTLATSALRFRL